MSNSFKFNETHITYHHSWKDFFDDKILSNLRSIEKNTGNNYTPDTNRIFRFLELDLAKIKAVILRSGPLSSKKSCNRQGF